MAMATKESGSTNTPGQLTRAAFRDLFFRYSEEMHGYAAKLLNSSAEASDIVQVVFEHLWRRRDAWQEAGSARAYLYRAVRHRCLDELKRRRVRRRHEDTVQQRHLDLKTTSALRNGLVPGPDAQLEERELRAVLTGAIDELPPRQQEAFVLVNQQGMSYDEAAGAMGITRSTVAVHVHKALQALRRAAEPLLVEGRHPQ